MDKPKVIAWMADAPVADDDPDREVKLRARALSDAAEVLGEVARRAEAGERARCVGEAADLFADAAFDPEQTWDAGLAAGLTDYDLDAASYVALELENVERGYPE